MTANLADRVEGLKRMPIMLGWRAEQIISEVRSAGVSVVVVSVPWHIMEPHERQARENHGQSLARLAERGGLSACEALAIIEDRKWQRMTPAESHSALAALLRAKEADREG
ncbi:hypothetical protein ACJ4V0_15970 [Phreatobacter sp. HK31-P]